MNRKKKDKEARELLNKYLQDKCTPEEKQRVSEWFYSFESNKEAADQEVGKRDMAREINKKLIGTLGEGKGTIEIRKRKNIRIAAAAAILVTILTAGTLWYQLRSYTSTLQTVHNTSLEQESPDGDILPGTKQAHIQYPDGKKKALTDSHSKVDDNRHLCSSGDILLEVPLAGEFELMLEDGTKVWLNSSTELIYPTSFDSQERRVKLIGEAYFEVAKDSERPFRIEANGTEIEVLGTAFNVNAYQKKVQTTLVEGSVKIRRAQTETILRPGEEAVVTAEEIIIKKIDVMSATAWQRGEFYFDGNNLEEVMEQIGRWYNVEYDLDEIKEMETSFKGSIARNKNISGILEILKAATGREFRLEGRKIIIS